MAWCRSGVVGSVPCVTKRAGDEKYDAFLVLVGRRVAAARRARSLTQEQLAENLHIAARALQKIESGTENVTLRTIARIAETLGLDPVALIGGSVE
jgi:DNA-binding XRE family transcriptional regulator